MLRILNATLKKKKKSRVKSNIFHVCHHSSYLEYCDIREIRESNVFKKVRVTRIFTETTYSSKIFCDIETMKQMVITI